MKQSEFKIHMRSRIFAILVTSSLFLAGCTSGNDENDSSTEYEEMPEIFPEWNELTDDGTNWSNTRLDGQPYIVIFSAQWCNLPCMDLMHTIWNTVPDIPVMVMSTDNGSEISFKDWHDSADAHDDDGDEPNNNLTSFKFLLGDEEGDVLGVESPGTTIFVNKTGFITWFGKSSAANDAEVITEQWGIANED